MPRLGMNDGNPCEFSNEKAAEALTLLILSELETKLCPDSNMEIGNCDALVKQ